MPRLIVASTSKIRSALGDPHVQLLAVRVICNQDNAGVTRGNRNLDGHNAWGYDWGRSGTSAQIHSPRRAAAAWRLEI